MQREYEEFKVKINVLVAKAQKKPEEGWVMQDGTPWPGNNTEDHPGMIQVSQSHSPVFSCLICVSDFLSLVNENIYSFRFSWSWIYTKLVGKIKSQKV